MPSPSFLVARLNFRLLASRASLWKSHIEVFLSVPPLPRCDHSPEFHPPTPFVAVLSFLRYSGRLPPRSFIRLLPRICCLRPWSLMPLLHSGPFQTSLPERPFFPGYLYHIVLVVSLAIVPLLYCESSSCRQPASSGILSLLGSVPLSAPCS
jgi:hypothetical protein